MGNLQILLRQHVGAPCEAIVKAGDRVEKGTLIATPTGLGANIFSSAYGESCRSSWYGRCRIPNRSKTWHRP